MTFFNVLLKVSDVSLTVLFVLFVGSLVLWRINERKKPYGKLPFSDSILAAFFGMLALRWVSLTVVGPEQDRVSSGRWLVYFVVLAWLPRLVDALRSDLTKPKLKA